MTSPDAPTRVVAPAAPAPPGRPLAGAAMVWYAAYGSNLDRARFSCYLGGGRPVGSTRVYPSGAHGAEPYGSRPLVIRHRLRFARASKAWHGGAVAFLDPARGGWTYGRAWLVDMAQFVHLASQENAGEAVRCDEATIERALGTGRPTAIRVEGWYRQLLPLGRCDGVPVVTLTGDRRPRAVPHPAYLRLVRAGLADAWPDLPDHEVDRALAVGFPRMP